MQRYDNGQLFDAEPGMRSHYRKLNHEGLAAQLRPYICDISKCHVVRRVAIGIAKACELNSLQADLIQIALEATESRAIRIQAAYAVARIGNAETKNRLRPLAINPLNDDPDDELKGVALSAIWPGHLSAAELFRVLTPQKDKSLSGAYASFIYSNLLPGLQPDDLPCALDWISNLSPRGELSYQKAKLVDQIMIKAWQHLELPRVLDSFAKTACVLFKRHDHLFNNQGAAKNSREFTIDANKRRQVVAAIVPHIQEPGNDTFWLIQDCLLWQEDVPWLIECCKHHADERSHRIYANFIERLTHYDSLYANEILEACQDDSALNAAMRWITEPWLFDDPVVQRRRTEYFDQKEYEQQEKIRLIDPPPSERVARALMLSEDGNHEAWSNLLTEMTLEIDSQTYGFADSDVETLPGWENADGDTRKRIIDAAKRYLLYATPPQIYVGSNSYTQASIAGWPAILLLLNQDANFIAEMQGDLWCKWIPLVIGFSPHGIEKEVLDIVLKFAYRNAPENFLRNVKQEILRETEDEGGYLSITAKMEGVWDDHVAAVFSGILLQEGLPLTCMAKLLDDLVRKGVVGAYAFAQSLFIIPPPEDETDETKRELALIAAATLLRWRATDCWDTVWSAMHSDTGFGKDLMLAWCGKNAHAQLTETQLAELYIWLEANFPQTDDKNYRGEVYSPTSRDELGRFRDSIIQTLKVKGTPAACRAIEKIIAQFPNEIWLKWSLEEARKTTRQATWLPPSPTEILMLIANPESRLVRTDEELLDAVIASLRRLQEKLHGSTPMAPFLWDESANKPKSENRLSDYVKTHLEADLRTSGVIANREVEIRNSKDRGLGERTDILVQAFKRDPSTGQAVDKVSVVIESKGCWNNDLDTAMETQLKTNYLAGGGYRCGLYLIGWFYCDRWKEEDKKESSPLKVIRNRTNRTLEENRDFFGRQAAELCDENFSIKSFLLDATY